MRLWSGSGAMLALAVVAATTSGCVSRGGRLTFVEENDLYNPAHHTDRDYTHGLRLAMTLPDRETPQWLRDAAAPLLQGDGERVHTGILVGQETYTPRSIWRRRLIEDDRPWAGWLYVGLGVQSPVLDPDPEARDDSLRHLEVRLGVVGPSSHADDAQRIVHDLTGDATPRGWEHQLGDEPGLEVSLERRFRTWYHPAGGDWALDLLPGWRARTGNVHSDLRGGALVRFGLHLPRDFGPMALDSHGLREGYRQAETSVIFHAGLHGEGVLRNIFLDGNTFRSSHDVHRRHLVGEGQAGVTFHVGDFSLGYTWVLRTPEFRERTRYHVHASVLASYSIWF